MKWNISLKWNVERVDKIFHASPPGCNFVGSCCLVDTTKLTLKQVNSYVRFSFCQRGSFLSAMPSSSGGKIDLKNGKNIVKITSLAVPHGLKKFCLLLAYHCFDTGSTSPFYFVSESKMELKMSKNSQNICQKLLLGRVQRPKKSFNILILYML